MSSSKLLLALLAALALNACDETKDDVRPDAEVAHEDRCERGGQTYDVGDVIWSNAEHTQSCKCLEGGEIGQCTGAILDDTCERDGETYAVGDVIWSNAAHTQSCRCLEGGEIGQCTGAILDDDSGVDEDSDSDAGL